MHRIWLITAGIALPVGLTFSEAVRAQERAGWFAEAGFGPVVQDRRGNNVLRQTGLALKARVGREVIRGVSALFELTHTSISRNDDIAFPMANRRALVSSTSLAGLSCVDPCGGPVRFLGPQKTVIAGVGLEASTGTGSARLFASLAPGVYWHYEREEGTRATSGGLGLGVGGSVRFADRVWAVLDLHYHRLLGEGPTPRWSVPVAFGIQVR